MRKLLSFLIIIFISILASSCDEASSTYSNIKTIKYEESTESFLNPDIGFYNPLYYTLTPDGIDNVNKYDYCFGYNSLLHLRIDLSRFSFKTNNISDLELSDKAISDLDTLFNNINNASSTAIVRFAYDKFEGVSNLEPEVNIIEKHIISLCYLFNKYASCITTVECGLIGPWGEMHTSILANQETYNKLINVYLNNTTDTLILLRRPKFIYEYYGYTLDNLDTFNVSNNRLGVYNDGYLGSSTDLGTYDDREKETNFLSKINKGSNLNYYGGEVTIPSSEYNILNNAQDEMFKLGLSYLNSCWNDEVITRWKNTKYTGNDKLYKNLSEYDYINNHLGYRLVCNELKYSINSKYLSFNLSISNQGFGNLIRKKKLYILITDIDNNIMIKEEVSTYDLYNLNYNLNISSLENNTDYNLYLSLCDDYTNTPIRAIRFANDIWNEDLKSNLLLSFRCCNTN